LSQFVQAANGQGLNLLPNTGGNLITTYLQGEQTPQLSPAGYEKYVSGYYKANLPFVIPLPDAADPQYALQAPGADPPSPVKLRSAASGLSLLDLLVQQLANLIAGIGALVLVFQRKQKGIIDQIGFLGIGGMCILVLTRISGTIAQEYNPQRAFLQLLIVLGVIIAWCFQRIGAKHKLTRPWILAGCSAALGLFLVGTSGLSGVFLGGGTESNLANAYGDYRSFVANSQDLAAAAWVTSEAPPGEIIDSDRAGELRLETLVGNRPAMFDDITPGTTDEHAWVYATRANLVDNITLSQTGSSFGIYAFPKLFFDNNFNVVYTNGTSAVFHR
jgi:hypothetical protein